jgi:hypothetical protein
MWDKKIIKLVDPSDAKDVANKSNVDRWFRGVRTFITVCAATKGPLSEAKITVNSGRKHKYIVTKPKNQWSTVVNFAEPLYLDQGDVVNLVSIVPEPVLSDAVDTVASLLIELNM